MSRLLTWSDIEASRIPTTLGVCPGDSRLKQWFNEAEDRMLSQGRWWGSVRRTQFCVQSGCIVFPREIATIEQIALCGNPIRITNNWYNFSRLLTRVESCDSCEGSSGACGHLHAEDHNTVASYATTIGTDKKIRTYLTNVGDVGKTIIYQGRDSNGIWVRTLIDGVMSDGEEVTLVNPFVDTVTVWGSGAPVAVIKEATVGRLLVYSVVGSTERALAGYQPSETHPMYRSMLIPGFCNVHCCNCTEDADGNENRTITAIASLQHVPIETDNDWLIFQNLSAYKEAMIAVVAWEDNNDAKGNYHFFGTQASSRNARGVMRVVNRGGAIPLLQSELRKMTGDRVTTNVYLDETNRLQNDLIGFR